MTIMPEEHSENALATAVKNEINRLLTEGTEENNAYQKLFRETFEKTMKKSIEDLFAAYGPVTKAINEKLKDAMLPAIKEMDFSQYVTNLDIALTDLINDPAVKAHNRIISNFRTIMTPPADHTTTLTLKNLFDEYCKFVAANIDTDGREVEFDNGPRYRPVECYAEIQNFQSKYIENSGKKRWLLTFHIDDEEDNRTTEYNEPLEFEVVLYRYSWFDKGEYSLQPSVDPRNLSGLSPFEAYLASIVTAGVKIKLSESEEIEGEAYNESVTPDKEPEPKYE